VPASLDGAAIIAAAQNGGAQSSQEPQQVGFTEQKFEPSPLDELALAENNRGEAEEANAKCSIDNPATVKLRGLRVGMTVDEVHNYLPQATPPWADEFGYAEKIIAPFKFPQLARSPLWRDVSVIGLNFVDGKIGMVSLWYRNVDHWTSGEQFREQVARSLGIHGKWRQRLSTSTPLDQLWQIDCGGQTFRAGLHYSLGEYVPLVEWEDESAINLMISRKVDKAERIRKEAERRRKTFKP
jgi:hypothetical protein